MFYLFDPQGSPIVTLGGTGANQVATAAFDAWGNRTTTDISGDPYRGFGAQFGYYTDKETGLELLGHRYYDSTTDRFVTRDTAGYEGGMNHYAYVGNSPLGNLDPSGRMPSWLDPLKIVKCTGELWDFGQALATGQPEGEANCKIVANCAIDLLADPVLDVTLKKLGVAGGSIAGSCLKGLVVGAPKPAQAEACDQLLDPCHHWDAACFSLKLLAGMASGTIAGCLGGVLPGDEEKNVGITLQKSVLDFLIGSPFGTALGLGAETGCKALEMPE